MSLQKALQAIIDNPEDLTELPKIIAQVQALEESEFNNLERISKLQEYNRAYLKQIPTGTNEPEEEQEEEVVTLTDAQEYMSAWAKGEL